MMAKVYRLTPAGVTDRNTTPEEDAINQARQEAILARVAATQYQEDRKAAYIQEFGGTWEDTLDYIYRNGLDGYITEKTVIKTRYPKPEEK